MQGRGIEGGVHPKNACARLQLRPGIQKPALARPLSFRTPVRFADNKAHHCNVRNSIVQ